MPTLSRGSFAIIARSTWGADFYAGIRSLIGTAARQGIDHSKLSS